MFASPSLLGQHSDNGPDGQRQTVSSWTGIILSYRSVTGWRSLGVKGERMKVPFLTVHG
ncbi:hypothetical protein ACRALDRAFT_1062389 [Sodiomyces alcalophilus JCM 7366]|uniref:uncharacterized protein n=1 Tax=Sodiomyces alcalophilus JCM 7366 TaxID=591952 RepID=UPI0039B58FE8